MAELETDTRIGSSSISDICLLVQDLERAIEFYRDQVPYKLRRLAPGFADFFTAGVTLALWQVDHMQAPPATATRDGLEGRVAHHGRRTGGKSRASARDASGAPGPGVPFLVGPQAYPERLCLLFHRPGRQFVGDLSIWQQGGHPNLIFSGEPSGPQTANWPMTINVDDHLVWIQNGATQNGTHRSYCCPLWRY